MEIRFTVPKWAEDRNIYVFAGTEVVARKKVNGEFEVKTIRCNLCGECCRHCPDDWVFGQVNGICNFLKYETVTHSDGRIDKGWFCKVTPRNIVPFSCCKGNYSDEKLCCVRFEIVDGWI